MNLSRSLLFSILSASMLLTSSCEKPRPGAVAATVNGSPILLSDLKREVALHQQQYPGKTVTPATVDDHVKTMIEQKLMIQEAEKAGIPGNERFKQAMERFREQTLIRELIDAKSREWEASLSVTEDEIRQAYERMRHRILVRAARAPDHDAAVAAEKMMKNREKAAQEEIVGPCVYDDVKQSPLENAFDMQAGETGIFPGNGEFVVLCVEKKQAIDLPPLADMRERIRQTLLEKKREQALAGWLETVRKGAAIQVNNNVLQEAVHAR